MKKKNTYEVTLDPNHPELDLLCAIEQPTYKTKAAQELASRRVNLVPIGFRMLAKGEIVEAGDWRRRYDRRNRVYKWIWLPATSHLVGRRVHQPLAVDIITQRPLKKAKVLDLRDNKRSRSKSTPRSKAPPPKQDIQVTGECIKLMSPIHELERYLSDLKDAWTIHLHACEWQKLAEHAVAIAITEQAIEFCHTLIRTRK